MSGNSSVGNSGVYQADDQRTVSDAQIEQEKKDARFHEGKENSHKATDSSMFPLTPPTPLLKGAASHRSAPHHNPGSFYLFMHGTNTSAEDERSIANKLEREKLREEEGEEKDIEQIRREQDATLPARAHGNEPSRGAKIDQQIREEEEAELKRKGKA